MSIKIQMQDGQGNILHPQTEAELVQYKNGNINSTLQTLETREQLFISDSEPHKDGLWIDISEITSDEENTNENPTLLAVKNYLTEKLGTVELTTDDKTIKGAINKHEKQLKEINNSKANSNHTHDDRYYTETEINNKLSTINTSLKDLANDNGLYNGNFQINQRKQREYNQNATYTVDRWMLVNWEDSSNTPKGRLIVHDGYIELTGAGSKQLYIQQSLEELDTKKYWGKKITVSCYMKCTNISKGSLFLQISERNKNAIATKVFNYTHLSNSEFKKIEITSVIPNNVSILSIQIGSFHEHNGGIINAGGSIFIKDVKLELGSNATSFVPRSFGEELALCQRYYCKLTVTGVANNTKTLGCTNRFPVIMRTQPTIMYDRTNNSIHEHGLGGIGKTEQIDSNGLTLDRVDYIHVNTDIFTVGKTYNVNGVFADAEIY